MIDPHKEIDKLLLEAANLNEKSKLGMNTALFFDDEVTKLENIIDNSKSSVEQISVAMNQLEILFKRILHEQAHINDDLDKLHKLEKGITNLNKLKNKKGKQ
jgi:hypothetical protein